MPDPTNNHAPHGLRQWITDHGFKHAWVAQRLGYSPQYLSRVLSGANRLTDQFRLRCETILEVPADVWSQPERP